MNTQFLRLKEPPFLLAMLMGLCAWLVVHTVDRLQQSPIIEYRLREYHTNGNIRVECQIENLCADKCFRNINFALAGPTNTATYFTNGDFVLFPPAFAPLKEKTTDNSVSVTFPEFHPGWRFKLVANKHGDHQCFVRFKTEHSSKEANDINGIRLLPAGISTFLIRHELRILAGLLAVAFAFTCMYLVWLNNAVRGGSQGHAAAPPKKP